MPEPRRAALITGASAGIGLELATVCAEHGHDLVLVARGGERLQAIARDLEHAYNVKALVIEQDLGAASAASQVHGQVKKAKIQVDILINNAGFGARENFAEADTAADTAMLQVNAVVPTQLTALFLPSMVKQRRGQVLNVASLAAFAPGPYMAVYHATKAYVLSWSQAVNYELKGTGVTVTTLCPGPTKTGWARAAGLGEASSFNAHAMSARRVARAGYAGMMAGKPVVLIGLQQKLSIWGLRLLSTEAIMRRLSWRRGR